MPNTQTSTSKRRASSETTQPGRRSKEGRARAATTAVERDDTYGLISVIYHALQGAETIGQYARDARSADNDELVEFFEECLTQQNEIAMKGKRLLAEQLFELVEEDDEEDLED